MTFQKALLAAVSGFALLAQTGNPFPTSSVKNNDPKPPDLADTVPDTPIDVTKVSVVQAPVSVIDKSGAIVNGLQGSDFRLFDNGKEQDIRVDVAFQPISLVIAIQCSRNTEAVLNQIKKGAPLFEHFITGEQGEAAVVAFDHRIREMQPFTSDGTKITDAIKKINAGSTSSRMIDAVDKSVYLLRSRPVSRRKIVLLISETRDVASEGKLREALLDAELSNVTIYSVNISHIVTSLTGDPLPPRPDSIPPEARNLPGGMPNTPTTAAQVKGLGNRIDFTPALKEIYKGVKAIFVDNPSVIFTRETGGEEFSFMRQRGYEDAVARIGEEIHSQYMITYSPNNKNEGGYHEIEVRVLRPEYTVRTRPGYYIASVMK